MVRVTILFAVLLALPAFARPLEFPLDSRPEIPIAESRDVDTLGFFFAEEGSGAYGMPGTFAQGYNFEVMEPAGWFAVDPWDIHWHVEDVSLTAGHGTDMSAAIPFYPNVPPNQYALWCGDPDLVGYGNNWDEAVEILINMDVTETLDINFSYAGSFEGEPYDYFEVIVTTGGEEVVAYYNGEELEEAFQNIHLSLTAEQLSGHVEAIQFWFNSDSAWSDEDGQINSDIGAVWLDNITVAVDNTVYIMADFENGELPSELSLIASAPPEIYPALHQNVEVPYACWTNTSTVWGFFDPDTVEPGYPGGVIPYGPPWPLLLVESPELTVDQNGDPMYFGFDDIQGLMITHDRLQDIYGEGDALLNDRTWISARNAASGEWGAWMYNSYTYWPEDDCYYWFENLKHEAFESAGGEDQFINGLKVRFEVKDMCPFLCDDILDGYPHGVGLLIDKVRVFTTGTVTGAEEPELPAITRLHPVHPNPFNPKTEIRFELGEAGRALLEVYDVSGRRLRTLADKHFEAGTHLESWNGLDDNGRALPSGVYFIRLISRLGVESRKAVLVQ